MAATTLSAGFGQDLYLFDKFLKEWYMAKWIDLLNNLTTTYKLFRRRIVPFKGRRMIIALRNARTGAIQSIPLSGYNSASQGAPSTVVPGYQGVDNAYVRPKVTMVGIGVPQDVVDTSAQDRGAFHDVIDMEMMGAKTDTANRMDLMAYYGGTHIGTIVDADVTTGQTDKWIVDNIYPFHKNLRLVPVNDADLTDERSVHATNGFDQVTATDRANRYVTVDYDGSAITADDQPLDGDLIYLYGARDATNSYNYEMLGLKQIVTNANLTDNTYEGNKYYLGINRTGNDEWCSEYTNLNSTLSFETMQGMIDDIHDNSGGETSVILTQRMVRRKYALKCQFTDGDETKASMMRFMNTMRTQGGLVAQKEDDHYSGGSDYMLFDGRIPIIVDRYCPMDNENDDGWMYFLDTRHWYYALVTDWKWWAPGGRILREAPSSLFGLVAHAYIMGELVCDSPNTAGCIYGITIAGW